MKYFDSESSTISRGSRSSLTSQDIKSSKYLFNSEISKLNSKESQVFELRHYVLSSNVYSALKGELSGRFNLERLILHNCGLGKFDPKTFVSVLQNLDNLTLLVIKL